MSFLTVGMCSSVIGVACSCIQAPPKRPLAHRGIYDSMVKSSNSKFLLGFLLLILLFVSVKLRYEILSESGKLYRREDYLVSWPDSDNDCQNLRHELLMRESLSEVTFTANRDCVVSAGTWFDPYTEVHLYKASDLDVDHVIPLAYAHAHGGYTWSTKKRKAFAIDQENLLLVDDYENSFKGSKGPSEYLPASGFHCEYLGIWKRIAEKYKIKIGEADRIAIKEKRQLCDDL